MRLSKRSKPTFDWWRCVATRLPPPGVDAVAVLPFSLGVHVTPPPVVAPQAALFFTKLTGPSIITIAVDKWRFPSTPAVPAHDLSVLITVFLVHWACRGRATHILAQGVAEGAVCALTGEGAVAGVEQTGASVLARLSLANSLRQATPGTEGTVEGVVGAKRWSVHDEVTGLAFGPPGDISTTEMEGNQHEEETQLDETWLSPHHSGYRCEEHRKRRVSSHLQHRHTGW